jgi:hypothetical protein
MTKVMDERDQLQQKYSIVLEQKKKVEECRQQ